MSDFYFVLLVRILISDDESGVAQTIRLQSLHVNIGDGELFFERETFRRSQQTTVFSEDGSAGKDEVGTALSETRARIDVGTHIRGRLLLHQLTAVSLLANQFITGREVEDDLRTRQTELVTWRCRHP